MHLEAVIERFPVVAVTVAFYDSGLDHKNRVQAQAVRFLERVAAKFA